MARNIEIKARVPDPADFEARVARVADEGPWVIEQDDTFFACPDGRLKLRDFGNGSGELIFYRRPDQAGPGQSEYRITPTGDPDGLRRVLEDALGVTGRVRKTRRLYMSDRTRIHLDHVEGLGDFMELEVVLADGEPSSAGQAEADVLMRRLALPEDDLIEVAYVDLLAGREKERRPDNPFSGRRALFLSEYPESPTSAPPRREHRMRVSSRGLEPMSDPRSDDELMLAYAQGEARAFDALYDRYRRPLYRYLFHATRHRAVADELFQDVWMRIVDARARFRKGAGFKRYAFRIAHNRLVDHWRLLDRRSETAAEGAPEPATERRESPEALADQAEQRARLERALAELSREQREAFLLQQEAGLSLAEIAEHSGVGRETVKSRLRYATSRLRTLLGPVTETSEP